jgi:hypothetical protein
MTEPPVEPGRPFEGPLEPPPQGPGEGQPQGPGEGQPQGPGEGLPGAPFEGATQAQFQSFTEFPPEIIVKVMQYLPPEALRALRQTSWTMATRVDTYIKNLINYGELTGTRGAKLDLSDWTPGEVLDAWKAGTLQMNYQPPSEAELLETQKTFDVVFADTDGRDFLLSDYQLTFEAAGVEAQKLDNDLHFYFQRLIAEGRLVNSNTQEPLPTGTPVGTVLELLKFGEAEWLPPKPNT